MLPVKLIAASVAGITSILGASSPLMYIGVTSASWKNKWHRSGDFSIPIFKNCRPSDGSLNNKSPLSVYLAFNDKGLKNQQSEIFLQVFELVQGGGKKLVWDLGKEETKEEWKELKLRYNGGQGIEFLYPYKTHDGLSRTALTICDIKNIEPITTGFGYSELVPLEEIKLTLSSDNQCRKFFKSVECDVNIGPSEKLRWSVGFKPKVVYTAF